MQDGQRILLTTPSVLVGFRVEVYRAEGTTQWYTAVIVGYNESTKVRPSFPFPSFLFYLYLLSIAFFRPLEMCAQLDAKLSRPETRAKEFSLGFLRAKANVASLGPVRYIR